MAEHDVIDRGLLEKALAGLPPDDAAQVRDACAVGPAPVRGRRDRLPETGRVVLAGPGARAHGAATAGAPARPRPAGSTSSPRQSGTCAPRGPRSPTWRGPRPRPHRADGRAGEERAAPPARRRARPGGRAAVRLHAATARRAHGRAPRLPGPRPGPARRRQRVLRRSRHLGGQVRPSRPPRARGALPGIPGLHRGRRERAAGPEEALPPNPEPDEELTLPDTPLYGTVRAEAWHRVHPLIHGDRGWFAGRKELPVLRGTLVHVTVERLPDGRDPHRAMWLWHAGPAPVPGRALARLPRTLRHRARLQAPQGHPRPHRRESPRPRPGRPLDPAPHGRARPAPLARPLAARPPPALGETARSRPAAAPRPGPPRISQHPPPPRDTRPCRETLPARTRQTQRQQQRPSTPVPPPRRSPHATHSKHDADQEKG